MPQAPVIEQDRQHLASMAAATPAEVQQIVQLMPLPCWVVDACSLLVLEVNPAAEAAYGYSREEFLAMSWRELAGQADARKTLTAPSSEQTAGCASQPDHWILRTRQGGRLAVEIQAHDTLWRGRPAHLVFATDITPQRASTQELKLVYECLDAAADMIVVTAADPDACGDRPILYVNRAFERRTGYARAEVIGRDPRFLQGPGSAPAAVARLHEAIARWEPVTVELVNYTKQGEPYWVEMSLTPTADERGWYHYWFSVETDITERKRAEQALQASNGELERRVAEQTRALRHTVRDLEGFNRMVSHDLQNPLNGVRGFAEMLQHKHAAALPADARRMLGLIQRSADHMHRVIEDLLALSHLNSMLPRPASVDVAQLCRSVCDQLRAKEPQRQVVFDGAVAITVQADRQLLQIVCEQLMGNAWKYTGQQPEAVITLQSCPCPEGVVVTFSDNGIGFATAKAQALFGPFQRLVGARQFEGTGIGLAIVARAVDRLSGWVWAEGRAGVGAQFHLFLPAQPSEPIESTTIPGELGHGR